MSVNTFQFKVKKRVTNDVIKQAAKNSRLIQKEAWKFYDTEDVNEIINMLKEERKSWRRQKDGIYHVSDDSMGILMFYIYLQNKGYISKPKEVGEKWW